MAEFIKTECPFCNQHYEVEDELIDKVVECPKCKEEFWVQPLSEEQIFIPPPPPPQIKLAPLFLNKSTSNLPNHNKSDEALFDPEKDKKEDKFVLKSLEILKFVNLIFTCINIGVVSAALIAGLCFFGGKESSALTLLFLWLYGVVIILLFYFAIKIQLSWFRGIYRNVMWFSFSQTMPRTKVKKYYRR